MTRIGLLLPPGVASTAKMNHRWPFMALLLAASACHVDGAALLPVDTVVLISIDSLRPDHLGAYGYPHPTSPTIDRLAETGWTFDRAYSTTSWTLPSHVALMTGLDNLTHRVSTGNRRLADSVDTLAEVLAAEGVQTVGFFSGPYLHPSFGLGQGFTDYFDCTSFAGERGTTLLTDDERDFLAQTTTKPGANLELGAAMLLAHRDTTNPLLLQKLKAWLASREKARQSFVFIHMWDVHFDYIPPQRYVELFDPDYSGSLREEFFDALGPDTSERDLRHIIARYDGEIRFTDDTLAEILEALDQHGMLDRAAILVTSDHGEEFLEHGGKGHGATLHEEILRIPLVLNLTAGRSDGARSNDVVSLIDLFPTVCELFGAPCKVPVSGESLLPRVLGASDAPGRNDALADLALMGVRMTALVRPSDKVIQGPDEKVTRYYDRKALRTETEGLILGSDATANDAGGDARRQLERRIERARQDGRSTEDAFLGPDDWNPSTRDQLRALGYIE